ncbi:hypothetical protein TNCV_1586321 [Trichonephila clavipes]|nr:hypothetical protein TNCV_1586321 [Trichonephila clavipes]
MDFTSSDSENENMDRRLEKSLPLPSLTPPALSDLEEDLQQIDTASNCGNFLAEIRQLIDSLEHSHNFDSDEEKNQYHAKKRPTPPPESPNKKLRTAVIETSNRYNELMIEDTPASGNERNEVVNQLLLPKAPEAPKFRRLLKNNNITNSAAFLKKATGYDERKFHGSRPRQSPSRLSKNPSSLPCHKELHQQGKIRSVSIPAQ